MGLVLHIVKKFNPPNETEEEEYTQAGMIGLMKSIRKHDPTISKLSTFAWRSIRNEILHYIKSKKKHKNVVTFSSYAGPQEKMYLGNTDQAIEDKKPKQEINHFLPKTLSEQEQKLIALKIDGHSTKEILTLMCLTESQLAKLYKNTLKKIKNANE